MDSSQKEKDEKEIKPENIEEIFCSRCLRIPEYNIIINKNKELKLTHCCIGYELQKIDFPIFRKNNLGYKCNYCNKNTFDFCLECKKFICHKCQSKHIPEENKETTIPVIIDKENEEEGEIYMCHKNAIQFICNKHFIRYQYFCPICEKNLCVHCKNCHVHINCESLFEFGKIKNITMNSSNKSDEVFIENLIKLCKIFKYSYIPD